MPDLHDKTKWWRTSFFQGAAGILLAIFVYNLVPNTEYPQAPLMAAVVVLMAVWWIFEVVPIPVTSLFPLFLLPLFDIGSMKEISSFYSKPIIYLFLGGFILALGLQQSGIHKRIALRIVAMIGSKPKHLVLGFMIACAFLSMWISNTASVMVMLPIGLSIMSEAKKQAKSGMDIAKFGICFMLGIAYAADIGGMATPIGTPPNLVFLEMYQQILPDGKLIGFLDWMMLGLPLSIIFLWLGWILLTRVIFRLDTASIFSEKEGIRKYLDELGPVRRDEKWSGLIFFIAALLWLTGSDIHLGDSFTIHGWRSIFELQNVSDAAVAVAAACLLFIIPSNERKGALLSWDKAKEIPWGILLLFGGGFAIAGGFELSGLSQIVAHVFEGLPKINPIFLIAIVVIAVTFLTELTSNTALTNLMLPILATASVVMGIDPVLMMIPATLAASCAFMMPVASPTQAIVFGSGYVPIKQMIRAGIWFNVLGILLIIILFSTIGSYILGVQL